MDSKKKVLFMQKMAGIAGSERYFLNIMPELKKKGWQAEFLMVRSPDDIEGSNQFKILLEERHITVYSITSNTILSFGLIKRVHDVIKRGNYDLVQTNLIHADIWGALVKLFFMPKLKILSVKHGYAEEFQSKYGFDSTKLRKDVFYWGTKLAAKKANKILAISQGLYNLLIEGIKIPQKKVELVSLGLPVFLPEKGKTGETHRFSSPQLLIVGRLVPVKQQHLVIQLLPALKQLFPGIVLVLLGDGESRPAIETQVKNLQVEQSVKILGFKEEINDYIKASDILLVPSAAEGFGMVILEGWRMHKPVIAFDVPAPNEIIENGKDGFLVPPFNTVELLNCIKVLLTDTAKAMEMGKRGFEKLQKQYSLEVMVNKTVKAYEEVLQMKH